MLDRGKRLRGKLLYIGIIAVLRVFFEKLHRILVRIDLLTGVCFVEILSGRTIEIIDKLLMLGIELCGNVYFDIFGFYDAQRRTLSASDSGQSVVSRASRHGPYSHMFGGLDRLAKALPDIAFGLP